MKKGSFILILLLIVSFIIYCSAETAVTHYIHEHGFSIDIPVGIACVSRDSDETNTFFQSKYFDYDTVHQYMLDNSFYLYGMTVDFSGEFALIVTDYDDEDFNTIDDSTLSDIGSDLENAFSSQGATNVKSDIYNGKKDKALRLSYTLNTQQANQYVLMYFTTHESKLIDIRFISFSDITKDEKAMIQDVFESINWEKKVYSTAPKGQTDINIYTDYETGLSFMVPSGWNEVRFIAGDNSKKVKYRIGTDDVWVLYESSDLWDIFNQNYGDIIKAARFSRADFDNSFLSYELVADLLGCAEKDISIKKVGEQEYYCMNTANSHSIGSLNVDTQNIVYICMREAYLYWFQLSGIQISKYEDQFNRFMKTVEYRSEAGNTTSNVNITYKNTTQSEATKPETSISANAALLSHQRETIFELSMDYEFDESIMDLSVSSFLQKYNQICKKKIQSAPILSSPSFYSDGGYYNRNDVAFIFHYSWGETGSSDKPIKLITLYINSENIDSARACIAVFTTNSSIQLLDKLIKFYDTKNCKENDTAAAYINQDGYLIRYFVNTMGYHIINIVYLE